MNKEMVGGCCVCSDERGWAENPLVYCDGNGCNVAVHQACYGIVTVPTGPWFCRKCESQERAARVRCELCPSKDGALKRTDNGGWAHVVCALYIPEVRFGNVTTMEPIVLELIPQDRYNKSCYLCEETNKEGKASVGACMQCNKSGCKQHFHVTCAQAAGLLCEEAGNYLDNVKYCGYCHYHYQKLKKGNSSIKTIPAFKPIPADNATPDSTPEKSSPPPTQQQQRDSSGTTTGSSSSSTATTSGTSFSSKEKRSSNRERDRDAKDSTSGTSRKSSSKSSSAGGSKHFDEGGSSGGSNEQGEPTRPVKSERGSSKADRSGTGKFTTANFTETVITHGNSVFGSSGGSSTEKTRRGKRSGGGSNSSNRRATVVPDSAGSSASAPSEADSEELIHRGVHESSSPSSSDSSEPAPTSTETFVKGGRHSHGSSHHHRASDGGVAAAIEGDTVGSEIGSLPISTNTGTAGSSVSGVVAGGSSGGGGGGGGSGASGSAASYSGAFESFLSGNYSGAAAAGSNVKVEAPGGSSSGSSKRQKSQSAEKERKKRKKSGSARKGKLGKELASVSAPMQSSSPPSSPSPNPCSAPTMAVAATSASSGARTSKKSKRKKEVLGSVVSRKNHDFYHPCFVRISPLPHGRELIAEASIANQASLSGIDHTYFRPSFNLNAASSPSSVISSPSSNLHNGASPVRPVYSASPHLLMAPGAEATLHPPDLGTSLGGLGDLQSGAGESLTNATTPNASFVGVPRLNVGTPASKNTSPGSGQPQFPQSLEQLLERQWEQGSNFLMEQAQHFDIASLLSCLHQLRQENQRLEDLVGGLIARRDHLLAINARLSIPLTAPHVVAASSAATGANGQPELVRTAPRGASAMYAAPAAAEAPPTAVATPTSATLLPPPPAAANIEHVFGTTHRGSSAHHHHHHHHHGQHSGGGSRNMFLPQTSPTGAVTSGSQFSPSQNATAGTAVSTGGASAQRHGHSAINSQMSLPQQYSHSTSNQLGQAASFSMNAGGNQFVDHHMRMSNQMSAIGQQQFVTTPTPFPLSSPINHHQFNNRNTSILQQSLKQQMGYANSVFHPLISPSFVNNSSGHTATMPAVAAATSTASAASQQHASRMNVSSNHQDGSSSTIKTDSGSKGSDKR